MLLTNSLEVYSHEIKEFLRTTRRYLIEKLALIPSTKLLITDIGYWLHLNTEELPQETLHVRINERGKLALPTIFELLKKRWQTLDILLQCSGKFKGLYLSRRLPNSLIKGIFKFLVLFATYLKICPAFQDFRKRNCKHD